MLVEMCKEVVRGIGIDDDVPVNEIYIMKSRKIDKIGKDNPSRVTPSKV